MTYQEYIVKQIENIKAGVPIYTAELAELLARAYGLDIKKANAATSVAMKRIVDGNALGNLRFYQKGIYYITLKTPFGEMSINKEMLIQHKYMKPDIGYETGYTLLHRLGLTTQMATERVLATNKATDCIREDKALGIFVKPPKTEITATNKRYLQLLDAIELMDKAPIDEADPYTLLARHMEKEDIRFDTLLALADEYYGKHTIIRIAHIATAARYLKETYYSSTWTKE